MSVRVPERSPGPNWIPPFYVAFRGPLTGGKMIKFGPLTSKDEAINYAMNAGGFHTLPWHDRQIPRSGSIRVFDATGKEIFAI